jgi:hypothetical protein
MFRIFIVFFSVGLAVTWKEELIIWFPYWFVMASRVGKATVIFALEQLVKFSKHV